MSWLSKAKRRAGRYLKKAGTQIARRAAIDVITGVVPGGKLVSKALSVAKTLGKKRRGRESARKLLPAIKIAQIEQLGPRVPGTLAVAMPGGAPLGKARSGRRRAPSATARPPKAAGSGRKPPKGGLDLKAMAAAWRAAGKPGKWIDWIRANPIRS